MKSRTSLKLADWRKGLRLRLLLDSTMGWPACTPPAKWRSLHRPRPPCVPLATWWTATILSWPADPVNQPGKMQKVATDSRQ